MAVLQMQRISICALKRDRKKVLEILQRTGVIEVNDMLEEDSVFVKTDASSSEAVFERNEQEAKSALEIINTYEPESKSMLSMFEGRKEVSAEEYDAFSVKHNEVAHIINKLMTLGKVIAESKAEVLRLQLQIEALTPWNSLDIPLCFEGTNFTSAFIGTLPNAWTLDKIYEQLCEFTPINVDIISESREQTCIFVLCEKSKTEQVAEKLKSNGFSYPAVSCKENPLEQVKIYNDSIKKYEQTIDETIKEILTYSDRREDIKFFSDYQSMRVEKYSVISRLLQSKSVFILTGYVPGKEVSYITELLKEYEVEIVAEETNDEEDVPVVLSNNAFSAPLEGVIESYSLPSKGEIDPTMLISIFYYAFFGLMLSDAMYGVIISLACGFVLLKFKNMEDSLKKSMKMFFYCGISTIVWGVVFSSYFGDVVSVVASTFFGKEVTIPALWINPLDDGAPMKILVLSLALGIIHIYTGMGAKFYQCIKNKDIKGAIYDVVFWILLLSGCIIKGLSAQTFVNMIGLKFVLPAEVGNVAIIIAGVCAIGIFLTGGRSSKNWGKRLLKGAYELYGVTSYLSDVLSYSRLLALGLATGVVCTVVNKIASMPGKGVVGAILFVIIFVFGNLLNLGINALGAYVHTNRLQYVEMFGKFYEGGGRKLEPFSAKTKYFKIKEKR